MKKPEKAGMNPLLVHLMFGLSAAAISLYLTNPNALSNLLAAGGTTILSVVGGELCKAVKSYDLGKLTDYLHKRICANPSIKATNIQDLFELAFKKAVGRVRKEYHNIGSTASHRDKDAIDFFLDELIRRSKSLLSVEDISALPSADFGIYLKGNSSERRDLLFSRLGMESELKLMNRDFQDFIRDKIIRYVVEEFWAELQNPKPENISAWREFQRIQSDGLSFCMQQMLANQADCMQLVQLIAENISQYQTDQREDREMFSDAIDSMVQSLGYLKTTVEAIKNDTADILKILRLHELRVFRETEEWIASEVGGKATWSPRLEEFRDGRVCVPRQVEAEVLADLERHNDVLLLGKPASGKTVFGLAIAIHWCLGNKALSVYFDVKDISNKNIYDPLDKAKSDIDLIVNNLTQAEFANAPILLILDNVHTNTQFSRNVLEYIVTLRKKGVDICALFLSRPISRGQTNRNNLWSMPNLKPRDFTANEDAFQCVASRMAASENIDLTFEIATTQKWISACGGDLIAFAIAFDPYQPDSLDKQKIYKKVREDYLGQAAIQPGGRDKFLDLCVLNSLDIDLEFEKAWKVYLMEEVFPDFEKEMIIEIVQLSPINPHQYCRLFHPSLASLCLEVDMDQNEHEDKALRLFKLCKNLPQNLGWVLSRMNTREYWDRNDVERFVALVKDDPALVVKANAHTPALFNVYNPWGIVVNWRELLSDAESYSCLVRGLTQTTLDSITYFRKNLEKHTLAKEAGELMHAVLLKPELLQRIKLSPADLIVGFLNNLPDHEYKEQKDEILFNLLPDIKFRKKLCNSPGDVIANFLIFLRGTSAACLAPELTVFVINHTEFKQRIIGINTALTTFLLKYLNETEARDSVPDLVNRIVFSMGFTDNLARGEFGNHVAFLNFLEENGYIDERDYIIRNLLDSPVFKETLFTKSFNHSVGSFFKFISAKYRNERQEYLDKILTDELQEVIESGINLASDVEAASALAHVCRLNLPEFVETALRKQAGDKFVEVFPPPDYPQDTLLRMTTIQLVQLFTSIERQVGKFKVACIVCSLMQDLPKFETWLTKQSGLDVEYLKRYSEKAELFQLQGYFNPVLETESEEQVPEQL